MVRRIAPVLIATTLVLPVAAAPAHAQARTDGYRLVVLPAATAWSLPLKIGDDGVVLGNDATEADVFGGDVELGGTTHPWAWTAAGRVDLQAGDAGARVLDASQSGDSVVGRSSTTNPDGTLTNTSVRWVGRTARPVTATDGGPVVAVGTNDLGDVLSDVPAPSGPFSIVTVTGARIPVADPFPPADSVGGPISDRRDVEVLTFGPGGSGGISVSKDGQLHQLPPRNLIIAGVRGCVSQLTATGFTAWSQPGADPTLNGFTRDGVDTNTTPFVPACTQRPINDAGVMAGTGPAGPEIWNQGTETVLGDPVTDLPASPFAINDAGTVIGNGRRPDGRPQPVVWLHGRTQVQLPMPTGVPAQDVSLLGLNVLGQVLGYEVRRDASGQPTGVRGLVWSPSGT